LFEIAMEEAMRCMSISRKRRNFNAVRACEMPEINSPTIFGRSVHIPADRVHGFQRIVNANSRRT
jgi:hypothetical protein